MAKPKRKSAKYSRENLRLFLTNAIWAYKEIFRIAKWDSILIIFTIIAAAILPTAVTYFTAQILDELIILLSKGATAADALTLDLQNPLFVSILALFSIKVVRLWAKKSSEFLKMKLQYIHIFRYIGEFYKKLSTLDIQDFENKETANIINKAEKQVFRLSGFLSLSIGIFSDILTTILQALILFSISPVLLLILSIVTIPGIFIRIAFINDFWEQQNNNQERFRKRNRHMLNMSGISTLPELRVSGGRNFLYNKLDQITKTISRSILSFRIVEYRREILNHILFALKELYAPLIFIPMVLSGQISIGDFSFYSVSARRYSEIATNLLGRITDLYDSSIAISDVRKVFQMSAHVQNGDKKLSKDMNPTIEFRNVSFIYPGTKKKVLDNINLRIETGDEIALVGENGAGKTTLIRLLLRFYDPSKGEILLGGINIKEIDINTYYEKIGVLFQDFNFYQAITIEENIKLGSKHGSVDKSLKMAEVYDDIMNEENRLKAMVGRMFTDGIELSKGQKQKLAIARMFYQNSPILILDEPTASIDAVAEHRIFKRIFDFMEDKTVIIISHRFSTVRNAQKIYVLDKGKIVEQGSHKELLKMNGKYKTAFDVQAEGYN